MGLLETQWVEGFGTMMTTFTSFLHDWIHPIWIPLQYNSQMNHFFFIKGEDNNSMIKRLFLLTNQSLKTWILDSIFIWPLLECLRSYLQVWKTVAFNLAYFLLYIHIICIWCHVCSFWSWIFLGYYCLSTTHPNVKRRSLSDHPSPCQ